MRQEAQLEALKQRIAESARKAGLDSEFETLEKNIKVPSYSIFHFVLIMAPSVNLSQQWNRGTQLYCQTRLTMTFTSDFGTSTSELRIRQSRCMSSTRLPFQLQWKKTKLA
jgi:hypothetical protein